MFAFYTVGTHQILKTLVFRSGQDRTSGVGHQAVSIAEFYAFLKHCIRGS